MSDEMKPVGWVNPDHLPDDKFPWVDTTLHGSEGARNTCALYTADQLAEAVAKERERCAKVCEDKLPSRATVANKDMLAGEMCALAFAAQAIREGATARANSVAARNNKNV